MSIKVQNLNSHIGRQQQASRLLLRQIFGDACNDNLIGNRPWSNLNEALILPDKESVIVEPGKRYLTLPHCPIYPCRVLSSTFRVSLIHTVPEEARVILIRPHYFNTPHRARKRLTTTNRWNSPRVCLTGTYSVKEGWRIRSVIDHRIYIDTDQASIIQ